MEQTQTPQSDVIGGLLKWASPVLIGIIGYLMIGYLEGIKTSINELKGEIKNIQEIQKQSELNYYKNELRIESLEKRLGTLEGKPTLYFKKEKT